MIENKYCVKCTERLHAKEVPIFASLSNEQLDEVIGIRKHIHLKKSENLFLEGEKVDKLFIISDGIVKVYKNTLDGKEKIISILSVGDFLGETNVIGETKFSNVSATAIKDAEICTISKMDLDKLIEKNSKIALGLLNGLNEKLKNFENLATNLATNKPEARIASMLLEFIDKSSIKDNKNITLNLQLSREEMANYCGLARETLSRKFALLEKMGLITVESKKVTIINKEYLENLI